MTTAPDHDPAFEAAPALLDGAEVVVEPARASRGFMARYTLAYLGVSLLFLARSSGHCSAS